MSAPMDVSGGGKKKKKYEKDKPWDTDDIDHWHIEPVTKENPLPPPIVESSFATKFPRYREQYIREVWPVVTAKLKEHGVACELDLLEGAMTVRTTNKMIDPYIIVKARDFIKLLSRSIPVQQAMKILEDGIYHDVIKIKNMIRNKARFVKRRQRLVGPNGTTLKAIELVTGCYVMVQGNTVSAMGSIHGLKDVRRIVHDCMKNIHPIYRIKELMIKAELKKDPKLKHESWDRFLPKFKKRNVKRRVPYQVQKAREKARETGVPIRPKIRTPFPPAQKPRKVDLQLESGEYFLSKQEKEQSALERKQAKRRADKAQRKAARAAEFEAPSESTETEKTKKKTHTRKLGSSKKKAKKAVKEAEKTLARIKKNRSSSKKK